MINITALIQGPLTEKTIHQVETAAQTKNIQEIIISTWEDETKKDIINEINKTNLVDQFIISPYPKRTVIKPAHGPFSDDLDSTGAFNKHNRYLQTRSMLNGLNKTTGDYTLKIRSDETYNTFDPIIDYFVDNTDKYVTSDIYFRKRFHPSDHIICANTKQLLIAFNIMKRQLETNDKRSALVTPEQQIFFCYMLEKKINLFGALGKKSVFKFNNKVIMTKYTYCVDSDLLKPYQIQSHGKIYTDRTWGGGSITSFQKDIVEGIFK